MSVKMMFIYCVVFVLKRNLILNLFKWVLSIYGFKSV